MTKEPFRVLILAMSDIRTSWGATNKMTFIGTLLDIDTALSKALACMLDNAHKETNIVNMNHAEIMEYTGLSRSSVKVAMKELKEKDKIRVVRRGKYMLNPNVFCYGATRVKSDNLDRYSRLPCA